MTKQETDKYYIELSGWNETESYTPHMNAHSFYNAVNKIQENEKTKQMDLNEMNTLLRLLREFEKMVEKKHTDLDEMHQGYMKLGALSFLNFIKQEQADEK